MTVGPWIDFNGLECPVPLGTKVNFATRQTDRMQPGAYKDDLESEVHDAASLDWTTPRKLVEAIAAYRVVTPC